jgi:hypothetical protein
LSRSDERAGFAPRFEGREALEALLSVAGCPLDAAGVLDRFSQAIREGKERSQVIPELFPSEPRFPDPEAARRLYQNLFGLWALVTEGKPVHLDRPAPAPPRPQMPRPDPFGQAPDDAWVDSAWRHLESLDERSVVRLEHAFENRQDGLLVHLDEADLTDQAYPQVRALLFELWVMLEVGWPSGLAGVTAEALAAVSVPEIPEALRRYVDEALFEAEQDEAAPLTSGELARARQVVEVGLAALWKSRRPRADEQ